jgi:hypothetical protein
VSRARRLARSADGRVVGALALALTLLVALTWRKWGNPALDAGAELTTADQVAHGKVPYEDVRYFYGPAGLYALAFAFKVFGTSFTTAFAFGLAQTVAVLAVFHALAREWLRPAAAGLATGVVMAIGFSGTPFNLVLPHTNSATFGLLFVLLELLALARRRPLLAGAAAGVVGLTRPEFVLVAALAAVAWLVGTALDGDRRGALRALPRLALPALAIPTVVYGLFAAAAGTNRLLTDNLWPVDFIRIAGFRSQENWAPLTASSFASTAGRALVYCALLAAVVAAAVLWSRERGAGRLRALLPPLGAVLMLVVLDGGARAVGAFPAARGAVEHEAKHLVLGMSWLPALALAVAAWAGLRLARRRGPVLSNAWASDLALIAVAAVLGVRAYDAFNGEASYAPYYAAPLVLLAGILHQRIADRWPQGRHAALGALGAVAAGLAAYALVGLYSDNDIVVKTARGSYVSNGAAAPAVQRTLDLVERRTSPEEPILALPSDGGIYFMADRPPATYELMFLPGLLDSTADERAALARLRRERVRYVVLSARDFSPYGFRTIGVDYNRTLIAGLRRNSLTVAKFGDTQRPVAGSYPSDAFTVYERRQ